MKSKLILLITLFLGVNLFAKERLPEVINDYQPAIFPIISMDGTELYFDRKWHPENTGGIYDDDDIWVAKKLDSIEWSKPNRVPGPINSPESNILLYLFPDGNKALVCGKYGNTASSADSLTFGISRRFDTGWTKPMPLQIKNFYNKSKNYSATISADSRVLILSLEREDSFGGLDLYISFWNDSTKIYTEPKNLGPILNTNGTELAAYLALDNRTLYFASSGHNSKGKLDLFLSRREDDSWLKWSKPIPLDSGINSQWDESSISLNIWADTAYFTSGDTISDRTGIYRIPLPKDYQPLPFLIVQGTIFSTSGSRKMRIEQPVVFKIDNFDTDEIFYDTVYNGKFRFAVPFNTQYNIFVFAKGHDDFSFTATSRKDVDVRVINYDINLVPKQTNQQQFASVSSDETKTKEAKRQTQKLLGKVFFETNIDTLDSSAIQTISMLKPKLKEFKFKSILIVGHTDEVGTEEYNLSLSKRRATNTAKWISKLWKIPQHKIKTIGKGKSEPISSEHSQNRRAEIYLITNE